MSAGQILLARCPTVLRRYAERFSTSSVSGRLAKGTFWSLGGMAISRSLTLLASMFVARFLGRESFGELGVIQSTVTMFQVFAGFALGLTATKYVAEYCRKAPARAGRVVALSQTVAMITGTIATVTLYAASDWLARHTLAAPQLAPLLRISAPMLFLGALNGSQTGALAGFEAFHRIAVINGVAGSATFPLMILGAWRGGLSGTVWALVAVLLLTCVLNEYALRSEAERQAVPIFYFRGPLEWSILWRFTVPAVLAGSMVAPVVWGCAAMLVNRPDGYSQMGILNAANQWYAAMILIPMVVGNVTLPLLSERLGEEDRGRSRKLLVTAMRANAAVAVPVAICAALASPWIMRAYGRTFAGGWPTLVVTVATAVLLAIQLPVGQVIAASGRMWLGFLMNVGWAIVTVALTVLWLRSGALGLAWARLCGYVIHGTWTFGFAYWFLTRQTATRVQAEA